ETRRYLHQRHERKRTEGCIMESIYELWMLAHLARWQDGQVTVAGNDQSPDAVIATIYFTLSALGLSADYANNATREEIISWVWENLFNPEDQISWMMEEL